jgi:hypothetical protein
MSDYFLKTSAIDDSFKTPVVDVQKVGDLKMYDAPMTPLKDAKKDTKKDSEAILDSKKQRLLLHSSLFIISN